MRTCKSGYVWAVVVTFLLAALWFFFPVDEPDGKCLPFAMRLALPAAILAIGGIGLLPRLMTAGFVFCAVGDAMGVIGSFEGQMGGFAVAHICFICHFLGEIRRRKPHPAVLFVTTLLCLAPLVLAALKVIPMIQDLPIRIGCSVYALLLTGTVWTSIVRSHPDPNNRINYSFVAVTGALFFLASDFILAWNKFVEHIPHASLCIMIPYYAALLLLFIGTSIEKREQIPSRTPDRD